MSFDVVDLLDWKNVNVYDLKFWNYLYSAYSDQAYFAKQTADLSNQYNTFIMGSPFMTSTLSYKKIDNFELLAVKVLTSAIDIARLSDNSIFSSNFNIIKSLAYTYKNVCDYCSYDFLRTSAQYKNDYELKALLIALKKGLMLLRYFPAPVTAKSGNNVNTGCRNFSASGSGSLSGVIDNLVYNANATSASRRAGYKFERLTQKNYRVTGCDGFNVQFASFPRPVKFKKYIFSSQTDYFELVYTGQTIYASDVFTQHVTNFQLIEDVELSGNVWNEFFYLHHDFKSSVKNFPPLSGDIDGTSKRIQTGNIFPCVIIDTLGYTVYPQT